MKILALEFSSPRRSVALAQANGPDPIAEAAETGGATTRAFALIEQVLEKARADRGAIETLAVGLGPGSYTGIRLALSIAQGWQLARGIRLLGISSAECLAHQAHTEGLTGPVHLLIDAQRNEFYLATYLLEPSGPRELHPLALATLTQAQERCATGGTTAGFDIQRHFPNAHPLFPSARSLATLALSRTTFVPGESLEPIYLRPAAFVKAPPSRFAHAPDLRP